MIVALVFVLGIALVVYARQSRPAADASDPQVGDHWHMAYGFNICGEWIQVEGDAEERDANGNFLNTEFARTGIHSHDDGVKLAAPRIHTLETAIEWNLWHSAGLALWLFGLVFESIADNQLHAFNQKVVQDSKTLNTGLWRYSRHPNYFGAFCIWWAWFIFAIPTASLWILLAPGIMTYLLMKFSGVGNMENGITSRRPDYQAYIDATNTFFPWKPRVRVSGEI